MDKDKKYPILKIGLYSFYHYYRSSTINYLFSIINSFIINIHKSTYII